VCVMGYTRSCSFPSSPPFHLPFLLTLDAAAQERVMLRRAKKEKARMVGLAVG